MTRFFSSIRVRLILSVLLAILPALALTLYTGLEQRRMAATQAQQEALTLARSVAGDQAQLIETTQQFVLILAYLPQVREAAPAACSAFLAGLLHEYPRYASLIVLERNGDLRCGTVSASGPVNYADRDWFARVLQTRDFVVGSYTMGRVTAKALIPFAYPIMSDGGQVQAVLGASIDLAWLNQFISKAHLPSGRVVTVIDRNGVILARHPDPERWVGQAMPEAPIIRTILAQRAEGTAEVPGLDGVPRLYAFAPLLSSAQGPDAYVYVGIPTAEAFAEPNRLLTHNLAAFGAVMLLALAVIWVGSERAILRRLRSLLSITRRLAAGDLNVRTGIASEQNEIGQMARAFDEMADALQQRAAQARHAEAELRASEERFRALAENAQDLVNILDADGTYRFASQSFERVLGYAPAELLRRNAFELIHPDDAPAVMQTIAGALGEPGATRSAEFRFRHRDGSWRVLEASGTNLLHVPAIGGLVVNSRDITERKRAVEALRTSEERFYSAFEDAVIGMALVAPDGHFLRANRSLGGIIGYSEKELLSKTFQDITHPDDLETDLAYVRQMLAGEISTYQMEKRYLHKLGQVVWVLLSVSLVYDAQGKPLHFIAQIQDITERKHAEEEIQRRVIELNALNTMATIVNESLAVAEILNRAMDEALRLLGVEAAVIYLLDEETHELVMAAHRGISDEFAAAARRFRLGEGMSGRVAQTGQPVVMARLAEDYPGALKAYIHKERIRSGAVVPLTGRSGVLGTMSLAAATPRAFDTAGVELLIALGQQLAIGVEKARLYESVRESERTLYALLDANPESALLMDTAGTVLIANEAITQRLGKDKRQLVGTNFYADLPSEAAEGRRARVVEVIRTGQPVRFEDMHGDRHIDNCIQPILDAAGKVARLAYLGIDITERVRMEEALQRQAADLTRSNRELQDFAYVASHDLQEPLRKVQAFGDRLKSKHGAALSEEGRDYLERMLNAAGRMSTMINDLLAYSRVTSKGQPFVAVDLSKVAREVIADLEIRIEETGGRVELGALPTLNADPLQMRQLLQNLIVNALKFHREGVPPVVKVYQTSPPAPLLPGEGGMTSPPAPLLRGEGGAAPPPSQGGGWGVGIAVEDNGIGFDEKYLDRIFTPFQRLHARGEYEGSGIGLAICRKIAERHGGTITARSTPGQGATFIVTLRILDCGFNPKSEIRNPVGGWWNEQRGF